MSTPALKQLKIKTGVVKRIAKEEQMYEKEVAQQEARIEKMKAEGKDEYDIKKQIEVLNESKQMIPDCQRRLEAAVAELKALLEDASVKETKELEEAMTVLSGVTAA
eukprot:Colp12_sorted_trinity150504_noHs@33501